MKVRTIRTLIEIDREIWSQTKAFATSSGINISAALKILLGESLVNKGFKISALSEEQTEERS